MKIFAIAALALSIPAMAAPDAHCINGTCPAVPAGDTLVQHNVLTLANNPRTKYADWVAYRVTRDSIGYNCKRIWKTDPYLKPQDTLEPRDYSRASSVLHTDRGHAAPLASLCKLKDWRETDYLSNITPQKADLNRGAWKSLEGAVRGLVKSHKADAAYILTGPIMGDKSESLPSRPGVRIPVAYWKIVARISSGKIDAAAFVMPQTAPYAASFCNYTVSIDYVENISKISINSGLLSSHDNSKILKDLGC